LCRNILKVFLDFVLFTTVFIRLFLFILDSGTHLCQYVINYCYGSAITYSKTRLSKLFKFFSLKHNFLQCCGSGMFIPDLDFYRTLPGSRILKQQQKIGVKKNCTKLKIIYFLNAEEKNSGELHRIIELFTQKIVTKLKFGRPSSTSKASAKHLPAAKTSGTCKSMYSLSSRTDQVGVTTMERLDYWLNRVWS
jgi:hypothetical protein